MKTSVNWPEGLLQRVKALAERNGFCVACVFETMVEEALDERKEKAMATRPKEKAAGICPACGEAVFNSRETDGPVWTCPADLATDNPYWQPALVERTEAEREASGFFGDCCEDTGDNHGQCYERMPLHSACYERGNY